MASAAADVLDPRTASAGPYRSPLCPHRPPLCWRRDRPSYPRQLTVEVRCTYPPFTPVMTTCGHATSSGAFRWPPWSPTARWCRTRRTCRLSQCLARRVVRVGAG